MEFVKNFALKYLPNVDNRHPIQKKIISNGDCFFIRWNMRKVKLDYMTGIVAI